MFEFGIIGYFLAAGGFFLLSILLLSSWRDRTQGVLLLTATLLTSVWAGLTAIQTYRHNIMGVSLVVIEVLRDCAWAGFIFFILRQRQSVWRFQRAFFMFLFLLVLIVSASIVINAFSFSATEVLYANTSFDLSLGSLLLATSFGVIVVEQLFRNITAGERWALKYLCLGVGGLFAFDLYLYSDALYFGKIDEVIWQARGYIDALVIPLIAVAAARNPEWSMEVFVSRRAVFYSAGLLALTAYLTVMAGGAYYIRQFEGSWAGVTQLVFLFMSMVGLGLILFSGHIRSKLRVFINKHFFNYRYDYRDEWLKFTGTLSNNNLDEHLKTRVIYAVADVVDSPAGLLWLNEYGEFHLSANWNVRLQADHSQYNEQLDAIVKQLQGTKAVFEIPALQRQPLAAGEKVALPDWLASIPDAWLLVPLFQQDFLHGIILLTEPRADIDLNWENKDLLIATGRQVTNHLALLEANQKLMEARQFETFNRLSAFIVHDLKNVIAQLSLLTKNAERHMGNPEFVEDAFATVGHAVEKMNRMLAQLRLSGRIAPAEMKLVDVADIVRQAAANRAGELPKPEVKHGPKLLVYADKEKIIEVLEHLLQNAQEATADTGFVSVNYYRDGNEVVIEISDSGVGMDADFVRNRLFKPFDTTKGNAGMGIGVYESREIVRSFGGNMRVKSTLGKGTTIKLLLKAEEIGAQSPQYTELSKK